MTPDLRNSVVVESGEQQVIACHSYRSGADDGASSNQVTVLDSIPDSQQYRCDLVQDNFAVQVKSVIKKNNECSKRTPMVPYHRQPQNRVESKSQKPYKTPSDAVYQGIANSPHIKSQYLKARLQNSVYYNRTNPAMPVIIPTVKGKSIAQTLPVGQIVDKVTILTKNQRLQDFRRAVCRHQHYQVSTSQNQRDRSREARSRGERSHRDRSCENSRSRSHNSNEINKDIIQVDVKDDRQKVIPIPTQPQTQTASISMPSEAENTKKEVDSQPLIDTMSTGNEKLIIQPNIQVSMCKQGHTFVEETIENKESLKRISTVYDSSPSALHKQINSNVSKEAMTLQSIHMKSEKIRYVDANNDHNPQFRNLGKHVQLTEFIENQRFQKQLSLQVRDQQQIEQLQALQQYQIKQQNSSEICSVDSVKQRTNQTAKAITFETASPCLLMPKLSDNQSLINITQAPVSFEQNGIQNGIDELAFANLVNSHKSDLEVCSDFDTRHMNTAHFDEMQSPTLSNVPQVQVATQSVTLKHPHVVADLKKPKADHIFVQQRGRLGQLKQSNSIKEADMNLLQNKHLRKKSVLLTDFIPNSRKIPKFNQNEPSQAATLQSKGFSIVAQRKQVVPNMWAEKHKWQRKRSTMTNNEVKQKQNILNTLPVISKLQLQNQRQIIPGVKLDDPQTQRKSDLSHKRNSNKAVGNSRPITETEHTSAVEQPQRYYSEEHTPVGQAKQHNSIWFGSERQTLQEEIAVDEPLQRDPPMIEMHATDQQNQIIRELQLRREKEGITTAHADMNALNPRRGRMFNRNDKFEQNSTTAGQAVIFFGSSFLADNGSISPRRVTTSHGNKNTHIQQASQHFIGSVDGSEMIRINRADFNSLDLRNNTSMNLSNPRPVVSRVDARCQQRGFATLSVNDGNKPMTAGNQSSLTNKRATDKKSRMLEFGEITSKNGGAQYRTINQNCKSMSVQSAKRVLRNRQRQIKDVFNMQDMWSHNVQNIKVSRLNDLSTKQDGPLQKINQKQQELDQKALSIQKGGLQTLALTSHNVQVKYQSEAFKDFVGRGSRFNKSEVAQHEGNTRMSLKKLIGRMSIHLPEKLKNKQKKGLIEQAKEVIKIDDIERNSSPSATSQESFEQKFQTNIMRQLLLESKKKQELNQRTTSQCRNIPLELSTVSDPKDSKAIAMMHAMFSDTEASQRGDQSPNIAALLTNRSNNIMSPQVNQIRLLPKEPDPNKRRIEEIAQRSREMVRKNKSRVQNLNNTNASSIQSAMNRSELQSSTQIESKNKDVQEMLDQSLHTTILRGDAESQEASLSPNPNRQDKGVMFTGGKEIREDGRMTSITEKPQSLRYEKIDSSDPEDEDQLNPMGIDDQLRENMKRKSSRIETQPGYISGDRSQPKHQVYSVYDDSSPSKTRVERVSSDRGFDQSKTPLNLEQVNEDRKFLNDDRKQFKSSDKEFNNTQDAVKIPSSIRVTSVKIQKAKSLSANSDEKISAKQYKVQNETPTVTKPKGKGKNQASLIKHVDQSLEQELVSGKDTIVLQSVNQSSINQKNKDAGSKEFSMAVIDKTPTDKTYYKTSIDGPTEQRKSMMVESIQQTSINEIEGAPKSFLLTQSPQPSRSRKINDSERMGPSQCNIGYSQQIDDSQDKPKLRQGMSIQDQGYQDTSNFQKSIATTISNEYPKMLNLISKKSQGSPQPQKSYHARQREDGRSSTAPSDILEQLNAMNTVFASHLGNGHQQQQYHHLEPKVFSTNIKASVMRHMTPLSNDDPSLQTTQPPMSSSRLGQNLNHPVQKPKNNRVLTGSASAKNLRQSQLQESSLQGGSESPLDMNEMGFVSHAALENRLHHNIMVKQLMEMRKREFVKCNKDQSVYDPKASQIVSVMSSQQLSVDRNIVGSNVCNSTKAQPFVKSGNDTSCIQSLQRGSKFSAHDSIYKNRVEIDIIEQKQPQAGENATNINIRRMRSTEKNISQCINLERLIQKPVDDSFSSYIESLVGPGNKSQADVDFERQIEPVSVDDLQRQTTFSFRPQRVGLMACDTLILSQLYKDHLKYEFRQNELHELLGESISGTKDQSICSETNEYRRYFLKFTGIQIVNVDCQSGVLIDIEPITLPITRTISLFFLSCDQLQQLISECLRLRKHDNQLKLTIDYELLRAKIKRIVPRTVRQDYQMAPIQVSILENIGDSKVVKDFFTVEIRQPRFEIVTTAEQKNQLNSDELLYKTTMTHYLTGLQMMMIMQQHHLVDWPDFAKQLIRERTFGVDSVQVDGESPLIKFQRLDYKNDFILYKDPSRIAQEERISQNCQLSIALQQNQHIANSFEKFSMHLEYMKPLYVKLQVADKELFSNNKHEHLPGYIPESAKQTLKSKTVAFMQIPFNKLSFIKMAFGDKIKEGSGCFLECLYDMVELQLDNEKDILRMVIPSWRRLEELSIRHLSQQYFAEQEAFKEAKTEKSKYLPKRNTKGEIKAILANNAQQSKPGAATLFNNGEISHLQATSVDSLNKRNFLNKISAMNQKVTAPAMMQLHPKNPKKYDSNEPDPAEKQKGTQKKRLLINNQLQCKLKISDKIKLSDLAGGLSQVLGTTLDHKPNTKRTMSVSTGDDNRSQDPEGQHLMFQSFLDPELFSMVKTKLSSTL